MGVEQATNPVGDSDSADVAVVLHLFYPTMADQFVSCLRRIPDPFDLYITVCSDDQVRQTLEAFGVLSSHLTVIVTENRGRDVKPFLDVLQSYDFRRYAAILKLHTKKSEYSSLGNEWRQQILAGLLPSPEGIRNVIDALKQDSEIALVAGFGDYVSNPRFWGSNRECVVRLCRKLHSGCSDPELLFVAGTMFWARQGFLYRVADMLQGEVFEEETGQRDGTLAHAVERFLGVAALQAGQRVVSVEEPGRPVLATDVVHHVPAVLDESVAS